MKVDVFLQPLVQELLLLWDVGVETYDISKKQNFNMRAALLWTINDFPAYAMLSGWSTAGRTACPHCMEDTDTFTLKYSGKQSWFDCHRKFLDEDHPFRRDRHHFRKNTKVTTTFGGYKSGDAILHELNYKGFQKVTEPESDMINSALSKQFGWNKKSIFWDFPYWKDLLLRHNLDPMHIEKNVFDNIFNTMMNIPGINLSIHTIPNI